MNIDNHLFFRSSPEDYEYVRLASDRKFGYPSGKADTTFPEIERSLRDNLGNILIAIDLAMFDSLKDILQGKFEEITKSEYFSHITSDE